MNLDTHAGIVSIWCKLCASANRVENEWVFVVPEEGLRMLEVLREHTGTKHPHMGDTQLEYDYEVH